jgi:hypothetical protein
MDFARTFWGLKINGKMPLMMLKKTIYAPG